MPGPYEDLRVVEFGRFIAAPYCGQLYADGGADVIKVEPLVGDDARRNGTRLSATEARQYLNKNRGKRSIAIDLGDEEIRALMQKLVASADVVLTNFRPGQAERLGLDYPQLVQANPRLIYAENTAFGKRGPMSANAGISVTLAKLQCEEDTLKRPAAPKLPHALQPGQCQITWWLLKPQFEHW